jgi:hypothetical protein
MPERPGCLRRYQATASREVSYLKKVALVPRCEASASAPARRKQVAAGSTSLTIASQTQVARPKAASRQETTRDAYDGTNDEAVRMGSLLSHGRVRRLCTFRLSHGAGTFAVGKESDLPAGWATAATLVVASKLHIDPRRRLEVVDWIVLDNRYAELNRDCEILGQAPPDAEIERQE